MIKMTSENGRLVLTTPYNKEFIARVKQIGGRWDGKNWTVAQEDKEAASNLLKEIFGTDGEETELVTVEITVGENDIWAPQAPIYLFGKMVASARSRNSGARVAEDVLITKGSAVSGGSAKNWGTAILPESVVVIKNVPAAAVENELNWKVEYGTYRVI